MYIYSNGDNLGWTTIKTTGACGIQFWKWTDYLSTIQAKLKFNLADNVLVLIHR